MRFVFVDRIRAVEPGRAIETLKNVSATEDVFDDHFPGCPVFPGALLVEAFEQASQLLIGLTHDWRRAGRLCELRRAAFRHLVRPGDQLRVRCRRQEPFDDAAWRIGATAEVDGRPVASAVLELTVEPVEGNPEAEERTVRFRDLARVLQQDPLALAELGAGA